MTKEEAIQYMIEQIEDIERERLVSNMAVDASKHKKEAVEAILKVIKGVQVSQ